MVITRCPIQDYHNKRSLELTVNSFWVTVYCDGRIIYKREPTKDTWQDDSHRKITDALWALELAVREACE